MQIGILTLQGNYAQHKKMLNSIGVQGKFIRYPDEFEDCNSLIIPGGESTTLRKLLKNSGLWKIIKEMDIPIMGTSAGAILLGKCDDETFGQMDIEINRNYYGRQKDSFEASVTLENKDAFNGVFIRAPAITSVGNKATAIAWKGKEIVGCVEGKNMALTFHPELTNDLTFHKMWKEGIR